MRKKSKRPRRTSLAPSETERVAPPIPLWAIAGCLAYFVLFYSATLSGFERGGVPVSRAYFVRACLLLPDAVVGNWFGEETGFSMVDRLPVLLTAAAILSAAAMLGWLILDLLGAGRLLSRVEQFVFSCGVGLNLVSLYVLVVGLAGGLQRSLLFIVPAVAIAVAAAARWWRRRPSNDGLATDEEHDGWLSARWMWLAVPFVAAILLGGMLPPAEFDVREYHLQVPKEFYQQGRITFLPHNVYGNMPLGPQMLSLLGMVILGDWWIGALVGKTIVASFAPLTAFALWTAGRRFFSPAAGVVAALVYISIPWIARVSNLGLVEGALAFYLLLSIYAVALWHQGSNQTSLLLVAGFLAGGAVACKYPALPFVVLPLAGWVWLARRRRDYKSLGVFLLAVLLGCGLWFGKNLALAGNPTYPLLYRVFGGETRTPELDAQWRRIHRPGSFAPEAAADDLAAILWRSEGLSPLLVPLAALAIAVRRERPLALLLLAYFAYVIVAWWLFTHRIDRFWIPALPILALAAGVGATSRRDSPVWRWFLAALMAVGLAANFAMITGGMDLPVSPGGYVRYFAGYRELRASPERVDPWHRYLNEHVSDGHAVLMVGDAQVFDLEVRTFYNTVFDRSIFEAWLKGRSPREFHAELTSRRISHVFVHWGEINRYRSPGNYGFTDFVRPEVLQKLVDEGVLAKPEPAIEDHPGQVFRVLPALNGVSQSWERRPERQGRRSLQM